MWNSKEFIVESYDKSPNATKSNTVILSKFNGANLWENSTFELEPLKAFIFPNNELAKYFADNYKKGSDDYRDCMQKGDYYFHIVNIDTPKEQYYADRIKMTSTY